MEKIKFIKTEILTRIKHNKEEYLNVFFKEDPLKEFEKIFNSEILGNTPYELPDINLLDKNGECIPDKEAVKLVYGQLKDLPRNFICNECVWVALCLSKEFLPYVRKRWKIEENSNKIISKTQILNKIGTKIFFGDSPETRHALARLWWIGNYSYDKDEENHYWMTDFIFRNQDFVVATFERSQGRVFELVKSVYKKCIQLEKNGFKIDQSFIRNIFMHINAIGGGIMIDCAIDQIDYIIDRFIEQNYK